MFVRPSDFENVSGDLLEQYRDSIHPARGQRRADLWYAMQVLGFVSGSVGLWVALFSASFIVRGALDLLIPSSDFRARSTVSTVLGVGILLLAGFFAAWRSSSFAAGVAAGVATVVIAAPVSILGSAILLAIYHDPQTMAAIRGSGGLGEVFIFPVAMILPGVLLGAVGAAVRRLRSA